MKFKSLLALFLCFHFAVVCQAINQINVASCCGENELLIQSECHLVNSSQQWPPPIFKSLGKQGPIEKYQLNVNVNLIMCDPGKFTVTTLFKLHVNSSITTDNGDLLGPSDFCLKPASNGNATVARHCTRDPCRGGACVKKCCPKGMVFHTRNASTACEVVRNVSFDVWPKGASVALRYGATPTCQYGMYDLAAGEFNLTSNGTLLEIDAASKLAVHVTDEYCVETRASENEPLQTMALLCFPEHVEDVALAFLPYLLIASSLFFVAIFVVYAALPRIQNVHGLTVMCQVATMFFMYTCLAMNQLSIGTANNTSCVFLASVTHFAFLSVFTWLNVMCFDIWLALKNFSPRKSKYGRKAVGPRLVLYSIYAWGAPLIVVSIGQILQSIYGTASERVITPSFGLETCFFPKSIKGPYWAYLYGPIGLLILVNFVLFAMVLFNLLNAGADNVLAATRERNKQKLSVILSLFVLMGVSWTLEVISFAAGGSSHAWLPFDVLNILTSVFMFVILVCKPNIWKQLKNKFPSLARLDACCPSFMKRSGTSRVVTSSKSDVKHKLSVANSNASGSARSPDCEEASKNSANLTLLSRVDRGSSQSNRSSQGHSRV